MRLLHGMIGAAALAMSSAVGSAYEDNGLDAYEFGKMLAAIEYCDLLYDLRAIAEFIDVQARRGWTITDLRRGQQDFMRDHGDMEIRGLEAVAICTTASARLHALGLQQR